MDATSKRTPQRTQVPRPKRFQVEQDGRRTVISWRWFGVKHIQDALFCFIWYGGLFYGYRLMLQQDVPLAMLLFCLIFVAAGLLVVRRMLTGMNRTHIEATREGLTIRHGPIPWYSPDHTLPRSQLAQLQAQAIEGDEGAVFHQLCALDRQGQPITLLAGLENQDQALYLEQILKQQLGIEDTPMAEKPARRT